MCLESVDRRLTVGRSALPDRSNRVDPGSADDSQTPSLRKSGIRGSVWTIGGDVVTQLVRFVSNLILARLLFPALFGQAALVYTFLTGLQLFSDVGTASAIIQNPRGDDPRFLRTAWTVTAIRGFVLWGAAWLIAIPAAGLYDQPSLRWLIPAAAVGAVLNGFESTALYVERRHLRLERLTILDISSQVAGSVVTIILALLSRSLLGSNDPRAIWAIVAGSVVNAAARLVLSHTLLPGIRHRFEMDVEAARSLFRFGRWVFVSTVLTFMAGPADRLVLGKLIPLSLLGVYGLASNLASIPTGAVLKLGSSVIFPAFSRAATRGDYDAVFPRVRRLLLLGGALLVSGLAAVGPYLIPILYDSRYREAGWMISLLAGVAWFQILESANGAALLAIGRSDWMATGNGAKLVGMLTLVPLGFWLGGLPGALAGLVSSEAFRYGVSAFGVGRRGHRVIGADLWLTLGVAIVAASGNGAGMLAGSFTGNRWAHLFAAAIPPGVVWGAITYRHWKQLGLALKASA